MSLYPHASTSYGAPSSYSSSAYSQPPAHSYGPPASYSPPPPTPHEVQVFRDWYMQELSRLMDTNRATIHRLAYIAREHLERFAPVISQCIEMHIRRAHPAVMLPSFYLLDSISKNIGQPYADLFSSFIASLFLDCYERVDNSTRNKMEEMLVTWRTGAPGGMELFGRHAQMSIERSVWGDHSSGSRGPTQSQVLIELDVILTLQTRALELNPNDLETHNKVEVLHQLRTLVQKSSLSANDLNDIVQRLRDLARTTASSAPPPVAMPPPAGQGSSYAFPQSAQPSHVPTPQTDQSSISSMLSSLMGAIQPSPTPPPAAAISSSSIPDVSQLFRNLVAAGLVSDPSGVGSAGVAPRFGSPFPSKIEPVDSTKLSAENRLIALREYEKQILSVPITLTASGLQKSQPNVIAMMYDKLPLKCKQCAKRFSDDEMGRKARDNHLDMHFRQNKRSNQAVGRGHCRSWFVGLDDWIHDMSELSIDDSKGKSNVEGVVAPNSAKAVAAAAAQKDAQLRSMHVVVPPGDESKTITCPICKEQLKSEFMEDEEEWVWKNAISVKGKVYHATCHADALSSRAASRLREQVSSKVGTPVPRSRSGTPESTPRSPSHKGLLTPPPTSAQNPSLKRKSPSKDDDIPSISTTLSDQAPPTESLGTELSINAKSELDDNNDAHVSKKARESSGGLLESDSVE